MQFSGGDTMSHFVVTEINPHTENTWAWGRLETFTLWQTKMPLPCLVNILQLLPAVLEITARFPSDSALRYSTGTIIQGAHDETSHFVPNFCFPLSAKNWDHLTLCDFPTLTVIPLFLIGNNFRMFRHQLRTLHSLSCCCMKESTTPSDSRSANGRGILAMGGSRKLYTVVVLR